MAALIQRSNFLLFKSILEFVLHEYVTFTFSNKINFIIIIRSELIILITKMTLRCLEHGLHPLDDVVDDIGVISFDGVDVLFLWTQPKQITSDEVISNCLFENLDGAKNTVGLGDTLLHEVVQFIL